MSSSWSPSLPPAPPTAPLQSPVVNLPTYDESAKLYSILERALLKNPDNLYQLHDYFFVNSGPEPLYKVVSFKLNEEWHRGFCWISSALLRSVSPSKLASLQPYLMNILLLPVGGGGLTKYEVVISLRVNFTESDYPDYNATISPILQELASLVSM